MAFLSGKNNNFKFAFSKPFIPQEIENIGIFNNRVIITLVNANENSEKNSAIENEIKIIRIRHSSRKPTYYKNVFKDKVENLFEDKDNINQIQLSETIDYLKQTDAIENSYELSNRYLMYTL